MKRYYGLKVGGKARNHHIKVKLVLRAIGDKRVYIDTVSHNLRRMGCHVRSHQGLANWIVANMSHLLDIQKDRDKRNTYKRRG